ncbi:MAG: CoA transferase [Deltaproteobacteria bacterium]|nr:CoA transferase [Deltaproteobacteria bacterium]
MTFLNDITVLELSEHISASACTKMMVALGADVIKIEPPNKGERSRYMGPFPNDEPHPEKSGLFLYLNMGKKGITLDITQKEGRDIFLKLVKQADIIVEDLGHGVLDQLDLGYGALSRVHPSLVFTMITPFGENGPYAHYQAEDIVVEAVSGMMLQQGSPDREPIKMGGHIIYYRAGASAFFGSLAALYHAENMGEGQKVEVSIQETLLHDDFITIEAALARGEDIRRRLAPMLLPCSDGWFYIRAFPHEWPRLTKALGMPELENDERFIDMKKRSENAEELNAIIMSKLCDMKKSEIYDLMQKNRVTTGFLADVEDLFLSEQYKAHHYFLEIEHPVAGKLAYPGAFATMGDIKWVHGRAPLLGEHNDEIICGWLGYGQEDMMQLKQKGIV